MPCGLAEAYRGLGGGRVAVRSSAIGEDGKGFSFAGQYDTQLNVEGEEALREAVEKCLSSLHGTRARAYRDGSRVKKDIGAVSMSVVVQRMVDARAAGVLFTVDPLLGRRDRIIVDAVKGLGESLVSGRTTPDHYHLSRQGKTVKRELVGCSPVLSDDELCRLVEEALMAERHWGVPLDLEWAFDGKGELYWLQARPVTALEGDLHEFDAPHGPEDVYTRSNIGEMIPGAVCPLTLSTTVYGIDQGIQYMLVSCGAMEKKTDSLYTLGVFCGHLFFNLTSMLVFCDRVSGSSPRTLMLAICGQVIPELGEGSPASRATRLANGLRYLHYVLSAPKEVGRLKKKLESFQLDFSDDPLDMYREINGKLPILIRTYEVHLQSSAGSGLVSGVLEGILSRGAASTTEDEAALASLLSGAGGVESAELVRELDAVTDRLTGHPQVDECFCRVDSGEALEWLRGPQSGSAGQKFRKFLDRHGHRSFRELSMRQPCWEDNPIHLVVSIQASISARTGKEAKAWKAAPAEGKAEEAESPGMVMRWLQSRSQQTVRSRERTKSILVDVTNRFKRAYRHLGGLLAQEGFAEDEDLIFFLTHEEIGRLVLGEERSLADKAGMRRGVHAGQQIFEFPPVFVGTPEPLDPAPRISGGEAVLTGKPVSRGVVEGRARVVRTLDEAAAIEPGEILISPITDVGWTPYFNLISGLATDLGSVISHGAVIAREYGLPAVVNLRTASRTFKTGDRVILDGNRGTLKRVGGSTGTSEGEGEGEKTDTDKETSPCLQNSMS